MNYLFEYFSFLFIEYIYIEDVEYNTKIQFNSTFLLGSSDFSGSVNSQFMCCDDRNMQKVVIRGREWHGEREIVQECAFTFTADLYVSETVSTSIQVSFEHVKRVCSATIIINCVKEHCEHSVRRNNYSLDVNDSR